MKIALPLLALVVVAVLLWRSRRRRVEHAHAPVARERIARTATHFTADADPSALLEGVVERLVAHHPKGRPPRRYAVRHRDHRSAEVALRLLDRPELAPVCTVLVEADPSPDGTAGRLEVLDILPVDGVVDRLREVATTRDLVLATVSEHDPGSRFRDELLDLPD